MQGTEETDLESESCRQVYRSIQRSTEEANVLHSDLMTLFYAGFREGTHSGEASRIRKNPSTNTVLGFEQDLFEFVDWSGLRSKRSFCTEVFTWNWN